MKDPVLHLQLNTVYDFEYKQIILEFNYDELALFLEKINAVKDRCLGY